MSIGKLTGIKATGPTSFFIKWDDGHAAEVDFAPIVAAHPKLAPLLGADDFPNVSDDGWAVEWQVSGIDFGAAQLRRRAGGAGDAGRGLPPLDGKPWLFARPRRRSPRSLPPYGRLLSERGAAGAEDGVAGDRRL